MVGLYKCTTKHTKGDSRPKCVKKQAQTNKRGTKPVNNSTPTRQGGREEAVARMLTVDRGDGAQRVTTLLRTHLNKIVGRVKREGHGLRLGLVAGDGSFRIPAWNVQFYARVSALAGPCGTRVGCHPPFSGLGTHGLRCRAAFVVCFRFILLCLSSTC